MIPFEMKIVDLDLSTKSNLDHGIDSKHFPNFLFIFFIGIFLISKHRIK